MQWASDLSWEILQSLCRCRCRHMAQSSFSNHFIPLLRETWHVQLKACGEPPPHRLCDSAGFGCAYPCICVYMRVGTAGLETPTSCCANPAPPVAHPGTARAIHTSSAGTGTSGLSEPSCISHTPSHHMWCPKTMIISFYQVTEK